VDTTDSSQELSEPVVVRRVARNMLVQIVGRSTTLLLALAALMILTRYLGVEGTGDYLLVVSLLALLNFSDMGLLLITVRELSAGDDEPEDLLGTVLLLRIGTAIGSMAIVSTVTLALGYSAEVTTAVVLGSISYLFIAVGSGSLGAMFLAKLRMEFQVLANAAQWITFVTLVGVVVLLEQGLVALILAYNVGALANAVVVVLFSRQFVIPRLRLAPGLCRRILITSVPASVATIAWILYTRVDMVMLSKMKGAEAVGYYGFAYRFVDLAWPVGFFFVGSVYPLIAQHYRSGDHAGMRWLLQRSTDVLSLLVIVLATVLIVFAEPIVEIIASDEFLPATSSLRILALAIALMWIGMLSADTLLALGRQVVLLWLGLLGLAVNVGLNLVLIPRFSYDGAAVATVATEFVGVVFMMYIIARHIRFLVSFQVATKLLPVALAAGAVALFLVPDLIVVQAAVVLASLVAGVAMTGVVSVQDVRTLVARRVPSEASDVPVAGEIGVGN